MMADQNLIKLLIVDDDKDVRTGMFEGVDWKRLGFIPVEQAENGLDALEKIKICKPDVVLTDIKMDKMDGLELINYLSEQYPSIKIVLVSGYSDITYYQKALEYKVFDFILKPTCLESFEKVFSRLKLTIDQERAREQKISFLEKAAETVQVYSRKDFIFKLLRDEFSSRDEVCTALENHRLSLNFENVFVVCIAFCFDQPAVSMNKEILGKTCRMLTAELDEAMQNIPHALCAVRQNELACLCNPLEEEALKQALIQAADKTKAKMNCTVFAGVSKKSPDLLHCELFYKQAYVAMRQITYCTSEKVIFYGRLNQFPQIQKIDFDHANVINSLFFMKDRQWETEVKDVFDSCEGCVCYDYDYIDCICNNLYFDVIEQLRGMIPDFNETENFYSILSEILPLKGKEFFFVQTLHSIQYMAECARTDNKAKLVSVINQIINKNFNNAQLSLTFIGESIGKTSAYISNLYKQETDKNINDVITHKRIEYAKELLATTNHKTYRIAEEVGYADCSYFTKIFKKIVGLSPKEYRDSISKVGD